MATGRLKYWSLPGKLGSMMMGSLGWRIGMYRVTLQGTNVSDLGERKIMDSKVTFCNGYVSSQECNFLSIQHVFAQILQHHCNMHRISLDQSVCFFHPGAPSAMPKTTAWATITSRGCSFSICSFLFPHSQKAKAMPTNIKRYS